MDISPTSHASSSSRLPTKRQAVASTSSSQHNRASDDQAEATVAENKSQARAQAEAQQERDLERKQQAQRDEQRRLDGRLVSYGRKSDDEVADYKQLELNRERINEAYSAASKSEPQRDTSSTEQQAESHDNDAIDLVV